MPTPRKTAKIGDTRVALVKEYAQTYDTMTDAQAKSLVKRWAACVDQAVHEPADSVDAQVRGGAARQEGGGVLSSSTGGSAC